MPDREYHIFTPGGVRINIDHKPNFSAEEWESILVSFDIQYFRHFLRCTVCHKKVQAYTDYTGVVLCYKCVKPDKVYEMANRLQSIWYDLLVEVVNRKPKPIKQDG